MKLTQERLRNLIREVLTSALTEISDEDRAKHTELVAAAKEALGAGDVQQARSLLNRAAALEQAMRSKAGIEEAADPQQALLPDELKNKWMDMNAEVVGIMASLGIRDMRPSAFLEMVAAGQALLNAWKVSPEDLQLMITYGKTLYSRTDATAED